MDAAAYTPRKPGADQMCIGVATQQHDLEEEHAGGPDRGPPTEPRQDDLRDERLNLKEKEGAEENRDRKAKHQGESSNPSAHGYEDEVLLFSHARAAAGMRGISYSALCRRPRS